MAVQEFGIPSGFEADLESLAGVAEIKKIETEDRKVILYFDEVCLFVQTLLSINNVMNIRSS